MANDTKGMFAASTQEKRAIELFDLGRDREAMSLVKTITHIDSIELMVRMILSYWFYRYVNKMPCFGLSQDLKKLAQRVIDEMADCFNNRPVGVGRDFYAFDNWSVGVALICRGVYIDGTCCPEGENQDAMADSDAKNWFKGNRRGRFPYCKCGQVEDGFAVRIGSSSGLGRIDSAARDGIAEAMVFMSYVKRYGLFNEYKDQWLAFQYAKKAAEAGSARGMFLLGEYCANGVGVRQNKNLAVEYTEQALRRGFVPALVQKAGFLQEGFGVDQDVGMAIELYRKAILYRIPLAMTRLGLLWENGVGVKADKQKALKHYHEAALFGDAMGHYHYARLGVAGNDDDKRFSAELLSDAADAGSAEAQYLMAELIEKDADHAERPKDGSVSIDNYLEGDAWAYYYQSARNGYLPAIARLGKKYFDRIGSCKPHPGYIYDYEPSLEFLVGSPYRESTMDDVEYVAAKSEVFLWTATEQGDLASAKLLHDLFVKFEKNENLRLHHSYNALASALEKYDDSGLLEKAVYWYEKAAKGGDLESKFVIAKAYLGVAEKLTPILGKDVKKARELFEEIITFWKSSGSKGKRQMEVIAADLMNRYAVMLEEGIEGEPDLKRALVYYMRAADAGSIIALYNLSEFWGRAKFVKAERIYFKEFLDECRQMHARTTEKEDLERAKLRSYKNRKRNSRSECFGDWIYEEALSRVGDPLKDSGGKDAEAIQKYIFPAADQTEYSRKNPYEDMVNNIINPPEDVDLDCGDEIRSDEITYDDYKDDLGPECNWPDYD